VAAGALLVGATAVSLSFLSDRTPRVAADVAASSLSVTAGATSTTSDDDVTVGASIVADIDGGERASWGVIVDRQTLVTTVAAIAGSTGVAVRLADGRRLAASVLGTDEASGLAVLGLDEGGLEPDTMGTAVALHPGDPVWMAGHEVEGRITAMGRHAKAPDGTRLHHVIRLEVDQMKAKEGRPLVDEGGAVVGLCTRDAGGDVIGIPIDLATSAARSLRAHARLVLPWLGINGRDAEPDAGWPSGGAMLTAVKGPAAQAGLQAGDVVVALGRSPISSISSLVLAARAYDVGQSVPVGLVRDGMSMTITLTLGELP
jgi:S1-C subfamily serine protease